MVKETMKREKNKVEQEKQAAGKVGARKKIK